MKFLLIFFIISIGQSCSAQKYAKSYEIHKIKSAALKEKRQVWVSLPTKYHEDSTYSVLYVLDAEDRFDITNSITKELFESQHSIPELIVVGIPNIDKLKRLADLTFSDSKTNATGKIDTIGYFQSMYTGNGYSFLNFLEKEVVPFIDNKYRTNGNNTIVGHSIGGYFCAYILPVQEVFSAFQIYDASIWYNQGDAIKHIHDKLDSSKKFNVFISKGTSFDGPRINIDHHLDMIDSLEISLDKFPNLEVSFKAYMADHNGMYLFSLLDGLSFRFKNYKSSRGSLIPNEHLKE